MADPEQLRILKQGSDHWNAWRNEPGDNVDLSGASLSGADLSRADLRMADLRMADLSRADGSVTLRARVGWRGERPASYYPGSVSDRAIEVGRVKRHYR